MKEDIKRERGVEEMGGGGGTRDSRKMSRAGRKGGAEG